MISEYIFDELDRALKGFIADNDRSPSSLRLDLYTYLELKRELGYDEDDYDTVIKTWNGFHVIPDMNEDERTIEFL